MSHQRSKSENPWQGLNGPNLAYVLELYDQYRVDPESVDSSFKEKFDAWGAPSEGSAQEPAVQNLDGMNLEKLAAAYKLAENIRTYGHLAANVYPVGEFPKDTHHIDPKEFDLTIEDLKAIPPSFIWKEAPSTVNNGWEAIQLLQEVYTKNISYEFSHVHETEERQWLNTMVETSQHYPDFSADEKKELLYRLSEVEGFEKFLHKTFVGQKRFSIEGVDMLVPMLDEAAKECARDGAEHALIGMAHRGRLNVLAHVLGKPLELIFSEFHHSPNKELVPSEGSRGINFGWTGDVKYHLGASRTIEADKEHKIKISLANNPSHLEYVDPVVEGYTRAAQEKRNSKGYPEQDTSKALAILIHGDAAFPGEGIVAETLNLSRLKGYQTGGTLHIIANNLVGFTTNSDDSRSTKYASDLAKGFEIPIIHVNADDPEACIAAVRLAYAYRKRFQKDVLIDLIGYRRFGHNEMDDPSATQPKLYKQVNSHATVRTLYAQQLVKNGSITEENVKSIEDEVLTKHQTEYDKVQGRKEKFKLEDTRLPEPLSKALPDIDTTIPVSELQDLTEKMLKWPENFNVYPKIKRILERRRKAFQDEKIDWGMAESLAFASILKDGTPIRITGQDSERGTFAQRHLVLNDSENGKKFSPLHGVDDINVSFAIHNSPLSESSVVGFEYGYNVFAPETLVIWEAQYGDFANVSQVLFDQFLSAGRAKWGQKSGMVLLLPHGYEGQGPEHSSARLERFLQLGAENNWTVANVTTASQYFHLLRRQAKLLSMDEVRPLVVMTPKSLLRDAKVASVAENFENDLFKPLLEQQGLGKEKEKVKKILLCSGKIAIDLEKALEQDQIERTELHIVRVEQIYPFPEEEMNVLLKEYPNVEDLIWVQEEPKNMGSWLYIEPKLRAVAPNGAHVSYIGRQERSSTAGGEPDIYKKEQEQIIQTSLAIDIQSREGGREHV
ncbi:2-oxoglutarate dehydrogenase E1 component [Fictibacillus barbaricus]|uniref:2-oxoglutarate dehydrogenase E1 component n=1 Tax=Fictibacillus barbaricus TaxID=182136 RepID=A0ABU1TYV7_9BACL|nr:2-oxoglutarate dehydrogenase E1 component [Fictibacillus barbaricus]MDR7072350.1 2-oxoglutarate dehydrogenase E1 component [Fictibacillus barbaricus]